MPDFVTCSVGVRPHALNRSFLRTYERSSCSKSNSRVEENGVNVCTVRKSVWRTDSRRVLFSDE